MQSSKDPTEKAARAGKAMFYTGCGLTTFMLIVHGVTLVKLKG